MFQLSPRSSQQLIISRVCGHCWPGWVSCLSIFDRRDSLKAWRCRSASDYGSIACWNVFMLASFGRPRRISDVLDPYCTAFPWLDPACMNVIYLHVNLNWHIPRLPPSEASHSTTMLFPVLFPLVTLLVSSLKPRSVDAPQWSFGLKMRRTDQWNWRKSDQALGECRQRPSRRSAQGRLIGLQQLLRRFWPWKMVTDIWQYRAQRFKAVTKAFLTKYSFNLVDLEALVTL